MGTRAAFWVGDPRNLDNREWLGCIAWDGYPNGHPRPLLSAKTEEEFREGVKHIAVNTKSFATPEKGWPFPSASTRTNGRLSTLALPTTAG